MTKKNSNPSKGHNIEFLDENGEIVEVVNFTDQEYAEFEIAAQTQGISTLQFIVNALERYVEENKIQQKALDLTGFAELQRQKYIKSFDGS